MGTPGQEPDPALYKMTARGMRWVTEGSRLLKRRLAERDEKQIVMAANLGISDAYVSQLITGFKRPDYDLAGRIEDQYQIPMQAWRQPAKCDERD